MITLVRGQRKEYGMRRRWRTILAFVVLASWSAYGAETPPVPQQTKGALEFRKLYAETKKAEFDAKYSWVDLAFTGIGLFSGVGFLFGLLVQRRTTLLAQWEAERATLELKTA